MHACSDESSVYQARPTLPGASTTHGRKGLARLAALHWYTEFFDDFQVASGKYSACLSWLEP